jgi:hypothetical protein
VIVPAPAPALPPPQEEAARQANAAQKPASRRARSLFWPGFAFGFLLLSSITCGVSAAALGFNRLSLDDIRGTGVTWTPAAVTPVAGTGAETAETETAGAGEAPAGAPAAGTGQFSAGQTVRNLTNSRVNIRMTPGYLGKAASDVIGQIGPGDTMQIVGDANTADELTWWQIEALSNGQAVVGWVAEATASGVQILGPAQGDQ